MRRIIVWLASTISVVVLLFGYRTSTNGTVSGASSIASGVPSATTAATGSTGTAGTTSQSGNGTGAATTYTGSAIDTRWGPVQVQITVSAGQITAVDVVEYPTENGKDRQINSYALPILVQETLSAQSADVDMVSGATVTSTGYVGSLQSALDEAGV